MRLFIVFTLVVLVAQAGPKKTRADLQSLSEKKAWNDAYAHLNDVGPAERDAKWESLVEKIGSEYLKETAGDREDGDKIARKVMKDFPTLRKSSVFLATFVDV